MPDLEWNKTQWDGSYDWCSEGEEWSNSWGGSEAQWFGSIYPRIHRFLPAERILEIAPGFGRWTNFLLPICKSYLGIDLSSQAIAACKENFGHIGHAEFVLNDGLSLDAAEDDQFDFVFSFDSLVHAELDVLEQYIPQLMRKLSGSGVAFIHHSNFRTMDSRLDNPHGRATSVSATEYSRVVNSSGGKVLTQEVINWGGPHLIDCLTTFGKAEAFADCETVRILNARWVEEMDLIRETQSPYSTVQNTLGGWGRTMRDSAVLSG